MQMLLESSIFCTQQVTNMLHTRWRGKAGGPHQLVVTMEALAGLHAVPIRILDGGAAKRAGRISWWSPLRSSQGHTPLPSGLSG
jgi:hypothetical protein